MAQKARIERLAATVASDPTVEALLVLNPANIRYLMDEPQMSGGALLISKDLQVFAVDQGDAFPEQPFRREPSQESADLCSARLVLSKSGGAIGFEDDFVTPADLKALQAHSVEENTFLPVAGLVESLRAVKEPDEVSRIQAAMEVTDQALGAVAEQSWSGRAEREISRTLEEMMIELGAEGPAFPTIVSSQTRTSMAHGVPTDAVLAPGDLVLVDIGAKLDGYASDTTRMFSVGDLDGSVMEVYEILLQAQEAGLQAVRAGVRGEQVDGVARTILREAGYGDFFGHGLGHGVGTEIHEGPALSPRVNAPLVAGNVVTVEPGIYLPGKFGMRIEDLVLVDNGGCTILSNFPKQTPTVVS
jgi:Xaa-Pro aminopeptidase